MTVSSVAGNAGNTLASNAATGLAAGTDEASERFLRLLVAQMQNQDPLNPMDNAQVTSQMAQINTVTGIEKVNRSIGALSTQFLQMQALQGASLVGRDVIVEGNRVDVADGVGQGGFELASAATSVKVEIRNGAGAVVETLDLGGRTAGMHGFDWDATDAGDGPFTFKVVAKNRSSDLPATPLMRDRVGAVSMKSGELQLELANSGSVAYGDVKAFN